MGWGGVKHSSPPWFLHCAAAALCVPESGQKDGRGPFGRRAREPCVWST